MPPTEAANDEAPLKGKRGNTAELSQIDAAGKAQASIIADKIPRYRCR